MAQELIIGGNRRGSRTATVLIDDEDYEELASYRWTVGIDRKPSGYKRIKAVRRVGQEMILMHRQVMGVGSEEPRLVDHINGKALDNRKTNLRLCTVAENGQNQHGPSILRDRHGVARTSEHRGVRRTPKYQDEWTISLRFPTEAQAVEWVTRWRREFMPFSNAENPVNPDDEHADWEPQMWEADDPERPTVNLPLTRRMARTREQMDLIQKMWADGLMLREIGEKLGRHPGGISSTIREARRLGYDFPARSPGRNRKP